jgi:hypothetical protein
MQMRFVNNEKSPKLPQTFTHPHQSPRHSRAVALRRKPAAAVRRVHKGIVHSLLRGDPILLWILVEIRLPPPDVLPPTGLEFVACQHARSRAEQRRPSAISSSSTPRRICRRAVRAPRHQTASKALPHKPNAPVSALDSNCPRFRDSEPRVEAPQPAVSTPAQLLEKLHSNLRAHVHHHGRARE